MNFKTLLMWCMLISVFFTASIKNAFGLFDFYWFYVVYLIVWLRGFYVVGFKKIFFNVFSISLGAIILLSVLNFSLFKYPIFDLSKQAIGFIFCGLAWWLTMYEYQHDFKPILRAYLGIAVVAAVLCIPEQLLHINNLHITPKKGAFMGLYRCYSFTEEPFYLAMLLAPALVWYLHQWSALNNYQKIAVFFLLNGLFMTFSGAAWIGILVYGILVMFKKSSLVYKALLMIIVTLMSLLIGSYHGTQKRISDTVEIFKSFPHLPSYQQLIKTNSSSRSIYLHTITAWEQTKKNPITGGGLGSHQNAYNKVVIEPLKKRSQPFVVHLNAADAASGLIRWISEMGLLGGGLIVLLLVQLLYIKKGANNEAAGSYWIIHLIHGGNYFIHGSFFFLFLNFRTWRLVQLNRGNKESKP